MIRIEKKYLAPNIITGLNLLSGFLSIIIAFQGNILRAAWLVILAMIFDGLDGTVARKLNAYSDFGKEFDSFADIISFGIAPGILVYMILTNANYFDAVKILIPFLYILFGVFRLIRFNIQTKPSGEKDDFSGMPIPTGAGLIASYYIFTNSVWGQFVGMNLFIVIVIFAAFSMISNIKYQNPVNIIPEIKYSLIFILLFLIFPQYSFFIIFVTFVWIINLKEISSYFFNNG